MNLGLEGKRALVMGSSRGLGYGIARALRAEGSHVMITGRSEQSLEAACKDLSAKGAGEVYSCPADLTDRQSLEALAACARSKLGGLDILVNNCGGPPPGPISEVTIDQWMAYFNAMAANIFHLSACFLPAMRRQGWGRVLNITSSGVQQPIAVLGISNTVRAAIVNWGKTLSLETAAEGVTINTILPGRISTERLDQLLRANAERQGKSIEAVIEASLQEIPAGRFGDVEEFASVAAFLVSERASYITGSQIRVDGGAIKSI